MVSIINILTQYCSIKQYQSITLLFKPHTEHKQRVEEMELPSIKVLQATDVKKVIMGVTTTITSENNQSISTSLQNTPNAFMNPVANAIADVFQQSAYHIQTQEMSISTQESSLQGKIKQQNKEAQKALDSAQEHISKEALIDNNFAKLQDNLSQLSSAEDIKKKREAALVEDNIEQLQKLANRESFLLDENLIINNSVKRGIVDYANGGKVDDGGSLRVTSYGYHLDRVVSGSEDKIQLKVSQYTLENEVEYESEIIIEADKTEYAIVTTEITNDTLIPRSDQMHMLVVKGNLDIDKSVDAIATLTSQAGIKTGAGVIENIKISDTQISGVKKNQYIAPMIPPQEIQSRDCIVIEKGTDYIQQDDILDKIKDVDEVVSRYETVPYNIQGFTVEKLQELNDLHDDFDNEFETDEVD